MAGPGREPSRFDLVPTLRARRVETFARNCWILHVACASCRRGVDLHGDELAARFPPQATAGEILDRMVCACGGRSGGAMIVQSQSAQQRRDIARFNGEGKYELLGDGPGLDDDGRRNSAQSKRPAAP